MKKKISTVQDFIPIRNLKHGIIETKDGRFLKILEIEPINFMLRSAEEQAEIIYSFSSWLKIAPVKLQFKSITKRADCRKHIEKLTDEILLEESNVCKDLGYNYISLVKEVGNNQALTRRFFLIFEYEGAQRNDMSAVCCALRTAEQNARNYFGQCGNSIIQPNDEDEATAEIVYTFFNRQTAIDQSFTVRVEDTIMRVMKEKNLVFGVDEVPDIPIVEFIQPDEIDLTHPDYVVMDGTYYSFLYIKGDGYPQAVRANWMSNFINAGEGIDVDVFLNRENREKAIDKVAQKIRLNRSKFKNMQDTSTDYEEISGSIQAGYYIKNGMANNEDLYYLTMFITVSGGSLEELNWRKQQVIVMLKSQDIYVSECRYQQEDALRSVMPFLKVVPFLEKKAKRNVLTAGAASTYMFTSYEMSDEAGVMLGVNRFNNSLCILDLFNSKKYKNANLNLIGTSGAGKTFTLQLLAMRMRMRGIQSFIIAPIKGHEFIRACNGIGGTFISIAPGSPHCINIMEIRHTESTELVDTGYPEMESRLSKKLQQLMIFFGLLVPDLTNEEEQLIDDAIIKTYQRFGITHDNNSIFVDNNPERAELKTMPVLGDLYNQFSGVKGARRVGLILSRFVTGSAQSFNRQTNVDLTNKYVVLDLSELKGNLLPIGMMIALDYVWDTVKADRTQKKAVFIDEIWQLVGASSTRTAADFCLTIFKTIRGFGGAAIAATQDLSDFFGLDDGKYGRAIINNSQNKIILNLEADEAKYVEEVLKLTKSETRLISHFNRGEALICSNNNKVPVNIIASKKEQAMITTDREELEKIYRAGKGIGSA